MADYIDCSTVDTPKPVIIPPKDPTPGGGCDCDYLEAEIVKKQDRLTAGNGIDITGNVISVTGISPAGVEWDDILNKPDLQGKLTAGDGISIDAADLISLGVDPVPLSTVQGWFV